MRERKYIKFRVSMYDDTKFKIIDMKPERDLIQYVWTRVVVLAGKVNLEGELYLSKTIPYTIETLAIEFNREVEAVKAAFDVLMELEMVKLTEDKVYKVINFAKHQNIKSNEKNKLLDTDEKVKNINNELKEEANKETLESNLSYLRAVDINKNIDIVNDNITNNKEEKNIGDNKISSEINKDVYIVSKVKNSKIENKKKKKDNYFEMTEEDEEGEVCGPICGEYKLGKGEQILQEFVMS